MLLGKTRSDISETTLMISLIVAGLYAEYLWARQPQRK